MGEQLEDERLSLQLRVEHLEKASEAVRRESSASVRAPTGTGGEKHRMSQFDPLRTSRAPNSTTVIKMASTALTTAF